MESLHTDVRVYRVKKLVAMFLLSVKETITHAIWDKISFILPLYAQILTHEYYR